MATKKKGSSRKKGASKKGSAKKKGSRKRTTIFDKAKDFLMGLPTPVKIAAGGVLGIFAWNRIAQANADASIGPGAGAGAGATRTKPGSPGFQLMKGLTGLGVYGSP